MRASSLCVHPACLMELQGPKHRQTVSQDLSQILHRCSVSFSNRISKINAVSPASGSVCFLDMPLLLLNPATLGESSPAASGRKHFSRLQSSLGLTLYPLPLPSFMWYMALFLCHACTMFYFYFPQDLNSCCHILFPFPKSSRPSASEPIPHCVSFLFLTHEKKSSSIQFCKVLDLLECALLEGWLCHKLMILETILNKF